MGFFWYEYFQTLKKQAHTIVTYLYHLQLWYHSGEECLSHSVIKVHFVSEKSPFLTHSIVYIKVEETKIKAKPLDPHKHLPRITLSQAHRYVCLIITSKGPIYNLGQKRKVWKRPDTELVGKIWKLLGRYSKYTILDLIARLSVKIKDTQVVMAR